MLSFRWEPISYLLETGLVELGARFHAEVEKDPLVQYSPDWDRYAKMEKEDLLRFMAVRDENNMLAGWASVIFAPHIHDKNLPCAIIQDIYVTPEARKKRAGLTLIWMLKEQLGIIGAQRISIAERVAYEEDRGGIGMVLDYMGFHMGERIWTLPLRRA